MENKEKDMGSALVDSVKDSGATDVTKDVAEIALDSFLDEGRDRGQIF